MSLIPPANLSLAMCRIRGIMEGMIVADITQYLPVREVAKLLKRNPRTIQRYVAKGYLKAEMIAGRLVIERSQLTSFRYPEPGNPLLKKRNT